MGSNQYRGVDFSYSVDIAMPAHMYCWRLEHSHQPPLGGCFLGGGLVA